MKPEVHAIAGPAQVVSDDPIEYLHIPQAQVPSRVAVRERERRIFTVVSSAAKVRRSSWGR